MFGKRPLSYFDERFPKDLKTAESRHKEETRRLKRNCVGTKFKLATPRQYLKEWLIMKHTTEEQFKANYAQGSVWLLDYQHYLNSCTNFD